MAIAFLLTASLFFAACQCIYRQKSSNLSDGHHKRSQLSLSATDTGDAELQRRAARRSSTYSTSIRHPDNQSISLSEFQQRSGSVVSVQRKAASRISSPVSGLSSPGRVQRGHDTPHLIYSPDFSNSLKDPRYYSLDTCLTNCRPMQSLYLCKIQVILHLLEFVVVG